MPNRSSRQGELASHARYHGMKLQVYHESDSSFWFRIVDDTAGIEVESPDTYKSIEIAQDEAYQKALNGLLAGPPERSRVRDGE